MIIAFDVDDTLANLVPAWLQAYNQAFDDELVLDNMVDWDVTKFVKPACGKRIFDFLEADLYNNVQPLPDARWAVETAREIARVIFVTSCYPVHMGRKFKWLNDHGFKVSISDYVECTDKSLIRADVLIDDRPANLEAFKGGHKFLIDKPWNRDSEFRRMYGFLDPRWTKVFHYEFGELINA